MATFTNFSSLLCNAMTSGKLSPRTWLNPMGPRQKIGGLMAKKKTDKSGWQVDTNPRCVINKNNCSPEKKKGFRKVERNSTCKSVYALKRLFGCLNNKKRPWPMGDIDIGIWWNPVNCLSSMRNFARDRRVIPWLMWGFNRGSRSPSHFNWHINLQLAAPGHLKQTGFCIFMCIFHNSLTGHLCWNLTLSVFYVQGCIVFYSWVWSYVWPACFLHHLVSDSQSELPCIRWIFVSASQKGLESMKARLKIYFWHAIAGKLMFIQKFIDVHLSITLDFDVQVLWQADISECERFGDCGEMWL